ncbi:hypothetical protein AAZX31_09G074400 [Glycine max]
MEIWTTPLPVKEDKLGEREAWCYVCKRVSQGLQVSGPFFHCEHVELWNQEYFVARNFMCFDMHYEEKEKTWQAHYESVLELERWLCRELGV